MIFTSADLNPAVSGQGALLKVLPAIPNDHHRHPPQVSVLSSNGGHESSAARPTNQPRFTRAAGLSVGPRRAARLTRW
jgi:hypothetical protein